MAISNILSEALGSPLQGYLFGLTMSTAGASTTLTVAAGAACDSTGLRIMKLPSSLAKTTSAWALGTAAGGLDTGSIAASTWYHWFLIQRPDTGVVDVLFSLSATAPTLPANYTLFRRIGSMLTGGSSNWTLFSQLGDQFLWSVQTHDVSGVASSASAATATLTVPTGVQVQAEITAELVFSANAASSMIYSPDAANTVAGGNVMLFCQNATVTAQGVYGRVRTNTSGQVKHIESGTGATLQINTLGWIDDRGRTA